MLVSRALARPFRAQRSRPKAPRRGARSVRPLPSPERTRDLAGVLLEPSPRLLSSRPRSRLPSVSVLRFSLLERAFERLCVRIRHFSAGAADSIFQNSGSLLLGLRPSLLYGRFQGLALFRLERASLFLMGFLGLLESGGFRKATASARRVSKAEAFFSISPGDSGFALAVPRALRLAPAAPGCAIEVRQALQPSLAASRAALRKVASSASLTARAEASCSPAVPASRALSLCFCQFRLCCIELLLELLRVGEQFGLSLASRFGGDSGRHLKRFVGFAVLGQLAVGLLGCLVRLWSWSSVSCLRRSSMEATDFLAASASS